MSKIKLTARQIKDLGLWDSVCEYKGWDIHSKANDEIIEFDTRFDAKFTEKELEALEKIRVNFNQLYVLYFNDLSPEARYKIDNINNISLMTCIKAGITIIHDVLDRNK